MKLYPILTLLNGKRSLPGISAPHNLYFDLSCLDSKRHRFKIILKPDLSTASLHVVNTPELTPHNFSFVYLEEYRICEDTLVSCWSVDSHYFNTPSRSRFQWGVYTGSTSAARSPNISLNGGPALKMLLPDIESMCRYILCHLVDLYFRILVMWLSLIFSDTYYPAFVVVIVSLDNYLRVAARSYRFLLE